MFDSIGQYKILERIGDGALGEIYRGRDMRAGRTVSVILVADAIAGDRAARARFLADAKAGATLSHPNIAAIYEIGVDNERLFLATEYIAGRPLAELIAAHPLPPRQATDYAIQIADALADAHGRGLPHGDLHAHTVVITAKDSAKVLDYGLSGWTGGQSTGGDRGDVHAFGRLLFQMLTATLPQPGWPAPAPSSLNRRVPKELDLVVARLLAQDDQRYAAAASAAADLRSIAALLDVRHEPDDLPVMAADGRGGRSTTRWLIALLAAVLVGALVWAAVAISRG